MQRPLSFLEGRDNEVLPVVLSVHCANPNPLILDVTHNKGKMWAGLNYNVVRMDIDPQHLETIDLVADFTKLPFASSSFDVIVFDPPHLPTHSASENSSRIWETQYGLTADDKLRSGDNVSPMFTPFLIEAKRVLKHDGIIIAKIADLTHNHRYQWQHIDFVLAAQSIGMTACDLLIKRDPCGGNMKSSKWTNVKHFRKAHCYFIIVRNGSRCERKD